MSLLITGSAIRFAFDFIRGVWAVVAITVGIGSDALWGCILVGISTGPHHDIGAEGYVSPFFLRFSQRRVLVGGQIAPAALIPAGHGGSGTGGAG